MSWDHPPPRGPISYARLNSYERDILSARPLLEIEVCRLYKSTLSRFLNDNGVQCHRRDQKSHLIGLVFDLAAVHENCTYPEQDYPPGEEEWGPQEDWGQMSPRTLPAATTQLPRGWHEEPWYAPPPLPVASFDGREFARSETSDSEASDNGSESGLVIEPCNALLNPDELHYGGDIECSCEVPVEQLLKRVSLSSDSQSMFRSIVNKSIPDIVVFLQNYGVEIESSGCRIHLLLMLRDLLEEQSNALQSDNAAVAVPFDGPSTSSGLPTRVVLQQDENNFEKTLQAFNRVLQEVIDKKEKAKQEESKAKQEEAAKAKIPSPNTDVDETLRECCICLQNQRNIAFVPCGHTLCCGSCARKLKECPVCRKKIIKRLRIFFS